MKPSKRKAKRLRKNKEIDAPMPKPGIGHISYKGFGVHKDKRDIKLKKARNKDEE